MGSSQPCVLVLAKAYPPVVGGVETYSEALVRSYLRRGLKPVVITQTTGDSGWREALYPEGDVQLYNVGVGSQAKVFGKFFMRAFRLMTTRRFSFMHATTWRPALALLPLARRTPLVLTVHGREVMNYPWFLKRPMIEILRRASVVVTVSRATAQIARQALHGETGRGRWVVAFNGISHTAAAQQLVRPPVSPGRPIRLLSLARLVPRKNIQGCIEALAALRAEGVDGFEYWIGGKGPMEAELRATVDAYGLQGHVRFLGYVPDEELPRLYQGADAFLHPQTNIGEGNDFEGFGLVIADAMSFGCTVLAGDAGGPRDFVADNTNGLLVDGRNPGALKSAIKSLILDADLRQRLSERGRSYALAELSWDAHAEQVLAALSQAR